MHPEACSSLVNILEPNQIWLHGDVRPQANAQSVCSHQDTFPGVELGPSPQDEGHLILFHSDAVGMQTYESIDLMSVISPPQLPRASNSNPLKLQKASKNKAGPALKVCFQNTSEPARDEFNKQHKERVSSNASHCDDDAAALTADINSCPEQQTKGDTLDLMEDGNDALHDNVPGLFCYCPRITKP